ncbi:MAG: glycosyltransferase family 4 protein [Planctomycetes bacterium]|nr:glycosyltransferase family 4 protein [Planctomycetota bacterium]
MSALHVAIAALSGTTGGPATYARRLVEALAATGELRLSVLTDRPEHFAHAGVEPVALPTRGGLDRLRWQYWALPRALRSLGADVFHDTKNALPWPLTCPAVVTVHDLAYHTVPETFSFGARLFLRRATHDAARRAAAVIVPSEATATDVRRFHPGCAARLHVVPHGIDAAATVDAAVVAETLRRLGVQQPYVLHVGTVQARKNVDLVVAGVRGLRARGLAHRCVVVGRRGWLAERAVAEIGRDDATRWLPQVDDDELGALYAGAAAFVSPSAYEGFGFAVADALAAGVPTVIADRSSLPELCGDAAVRLPALTAAAVTDALSELFRHPERAAELGRRGQTRAAGFTWRDAANGHVRAYLAARGGHAAD